MNTSEGDEAAVYPAAFVANLLTRADVQRITSLSRSSVYRLMRAGDFPEPVRIEGCVRWRADEVQEWLEMLPRSAGHVGVPA